MRHLRRPRSTPLRLSPRPPLHAPAGTPVALSPDMRTLPLLTLLCLSACTGRLGDVEPLRPDGVGGPKVPDPRRPGEMLPAFAPAATGLRRLTSHQLENSLRDLLEGEVDVRAELPADPVSDDAHAFTSELASEVSSGSLAVEKYDGAARAAAEQAFADLARRERLVGCAPESADDPCVRAFLERFLRRAWRRPATPTELDRYEAIVLTGEAELDDVWEGLEHAVAATLQSPHFLYRVELGQDGRFDGFEMATRLSYFLWETTPDAELLEAAASGALSDDEGLRAQTRRLLADPRAEPALMRFFEEWLGYARLDQIQKDPGYFPTFTPALGRAMRREIELSLRQTVFVEDGSFMALMDTDRTFVNGALARHYGLTPIPGAAPPELVDTWTPETPGGCADVPGYANLCSEGALSHDLILDEAGVITMHAPVWGTDAGGEPARMEVAVDGEARDTREVRGSASAPERVTLTFELDAGTHTVSIAFLNDFYEPPANRDLRIAEVRFERAGEDETFTETTLPPERRGLLSLAGMLSLYARPIDTSPTQRGLFIRERLLCGHIDPPPPGVDATLPLPPAGMHITNRERVGRHLSDTYCASCHSQMDPLGLPLEAFDGVGAFRETDQGLPLDLSGDLDGVRFDGPVELASLLSEEQQVVDCTVRQLFRHATGRRDERAQRVALYAVADAFADAGYSFLSLVEAFVLSDAFRSAGDPR